MQLAQVYAILPACIYLNLPSIFRGNCTWTVNLLGCFLAGVFFAYSQKYPALQQEARLLLMVGVLGGFTTFSSFGLETWQLFRHGQQGMAFSYALSSVVLGVMFLGLGFYVIQQFLKH